MNAVGAIGVVTMANSGIVNSDKRVKLSQVPTSVRRTILEHVKRSDIEKIKRSREDGEVVYEVEGRRGDYEFIVAAFATGDIEDHLGSDDEDND